MIRPILATSSRIIGAAYRGLFSSSLKARLGLVISATKVCIGVIRVLRSGIQLSSFQIDNQLAMRVSRFQISDRRRRLAQTVLSVDDRRHLAALHKIAQSVQ